MPWLEIIGWIGSGLVVWSLMVARVTKFRWMNLAGSSIAAAYNGVIGVWPFMAMNAIIAVIDIYWLVRLYRVKHDAAAFEVDLDAIVAAASTEPVQAVPVSTFPLAKEDFAFVVDQDVTAGAVRGVVAQAAGELAEEVRVFDVFTGPQVGEGKKSVAVAVRLRGADRTLTPEQTAEVRGRVV